MDWHPNASGSYDRTRCGLRSHQFAEFRKQQNDESIPPLPLLAGFDGDTECSGWAGNGHASCFAPSAAREQRSEILDGLWRVCKATHAIRSQRVSEAGTEGFGRSDAFVKHGQYVEERQEALFMNDGRMAFFLTWVVICGRLFGGSRAVHREAFEMWERIASLLGKETFNVQQCTFYHVFRGHRRRYCWCLKVFSLSDLLASSSFRTLGIWDIILAIISPLGIQTPSLSSPSISS